MHISAVFGSCEAAALFRIPQLAFLRILVCLGWVFARAPFSNFRVSVETSPRRGGEALATTSFDATVEQFTPASEPV